MSGYFTLQQLAIGRNRLPHLVGTFIKELKSEMANAECDQSLEVLGAGLRPRIEHGITATNVCFHGMFSPDTVAQFQINSVARPAAIRVIRSLRQERAENTMFHVKHRHVLMNGHFEPIRRGSLQERFQLGKIQVVRGGDPLQAELVLEIIRAQPIRDVEREIADNLRSVSAYPASVPQSATIDTYAALKDDIRSQRENEDEEDELDEYRSW